jgi:hypothetical protein
MATIALVQSYPYDADLGGDAAYVQAFAQYLSRAGHEVHGLVSDITRGRTSPVYRSAYSIEKFQTWQVRNALRVGQKAFVGSPATLLRKLSNLPRSKPTIDGWVRREAAWVDRTLSRIRPTATILVHDAVHFAPHLVNASAIFALVGHIASRRNLIDPDRLGSRTEPNMLPDGTTLAASLKAANAIGFNSRDDMAYAAAHLIDGKMCYVGMGYPFSYSACYGDFSTWLDRTIAASSHQSSDRSRIKAIPACIGARWRQHLAEPPVTKMSERGQYG